MTKPKAKFPLCEKYGIMLYAVWDRNYAAIEVLPNNKVEQALAKLEADISNLEFALENGYAKPKGGKK